ncbi:MAG: murein biosynthesis integral membrane protein MurJ [Lentisphaerae bacterium]|nr:murein biosynthesis integral membrane protein MurJ [Lentisphaerota bacterium]
MESQGVIRSAGVVGFWIMVSRLLGMLRDVSMAAFFGSHIAMDAFVVAFTVPNLFRSLFGEGALSSAFVPVFTESHEREGLRQVWCLAARLLNLLSATLLVLTLLGLALAGGALHFWQMSARLQLIFDLLCIMLPYMLFICLAAFFSAMLNSLRRFALPAAVPVVLNLVMLAALWLLCPRLPATGDLRMRVMAWSVLVAGLLQAALPLAVLWRRGFRPRADCGWRDERVRRVLRLMAAAALGVGVTQFNVLADRILAVWVGAGSPSYLYYAERLIYLPLGIFATALGTVLLPTLSMHAARAQTDRICATVNAALRQIIFITAPAALGMLVLARPIVRVIYQHGDFSVQAATMTAGALACYAPGLVMFSLLKVLVPVFHARQDMRTPVRVGIACSLANLALSLLLMWPLGHMGIALATVLASVGHVAALAFFVQRQIGPAGWRSVGRSGLRLLPALAALVLASGMTHSRLTLAMQTGWRPLPAAIIGLAAAVSAGALAYLLTARICRCRELGEMLAAIRHR